MHKSLLLTIASLVGLTHPGFSIECPKKVKVEVTAVESISSNNIEELNEIFVLGDEQTDKAYIQAVLKVAENLGDQGDTLKYSKKRSELSHSCFYKGKHTTLTIKPVVSYDLDKGYTAVLKLGKINYKAQPGAGNPTLHKGNALDLTTHLLQLDTENIIATRNRKSILSFDLDIQIPLGDYGTDGYVETVNIGKAWIAYSIAGE